MASTAPPSLGSLSTAYLRLFYRFYSVYCSRVLLGLSTRSSVYLVQFIRIQSVTQNGRIPAQIIYCYQRKHVQFNSNIMPPKKGLQLWTLGVRCKNPNCGEWFQLDIRGDPYADIRCPSCDSYSPATTIVSFFTHGKKYVRSRRRLN